MSLSNMYKDLASLSGQINHAIATLEELFLSRATVSSQLEMMRAAKGLVFMMEVKAGLIVSGSVAAGLLICRLPDGQWSAPLSIGASGMGFGFQVGAQSTDIVIALDTEEAVRNFKSSGNVRFGGEAHLTAGDTHSGAGPSRSEGRRIASGFTAYSRSHGLYGGVSIEGMGLVTRPDDNAAVYGHEVLLAVSPTRTLTITPSARSTSAPTLTLAPNPPLKASVDDILSGRVPPPDDALRLYTLLNALLHGQPAFPQSEPYRAQGAGGASSRTPSSHSKRGVQDTGGATPEPSVSPAR